MYVVFLLNLGILEANLFKMPNIQKENQNSDMVEIIDKLNNKVKEIENSNKILDQIFDFALEGLVFIDCEYNIKKINRKINELFELKPEDVINQKCFHIFSDKFCTNHEDNEKNCHLFRSKQGLSMPLEKEFKFTKKMVKNLLLLNLHHLFTVLIINWKVWLKVIEILQSRKCMKKTLKKVRLF